MSVQMLIDEYSKNLEMHKKVQEDLKSQYLGIIHNKNIALEVRWKTFVEAPHAFKTHSGWVEGFVVLDQKIKNFTWYDDMNLDRYATMKCDTLIERIEEQIEDHNRNGYETTLSKHFVAHPEWLAELKEEILQKNIGSFENDW